MAVVRHKEAIHSGHFMVSDFEAEAEDELDIAVPPPEEGSNLPQILPPEEECDMTVSVAQTAKVTFLHEPMLPAIDIPLNKLFQSMSIAYRQKLTSPKWNRFRGLKLRWKDKIRLNNVIWRCWHMQFIKGSNRLLCAFANPLEIDNHNRPEGGTHLEGKYWKRQLQTVTKQYMSWRMFYKQRPHGVAGFNDPTSEEWDQIVKSPFRGVEGSKDDILLTDDDFIIDTLFNALQQNSGVAVPFPTREIYRCTTNADIIQPGLGQLQPNLEDFFADFDEPTPLNDWFTSRLPSIQESPAETTSSFSDVQTEKARPAVSVAGPEYTYAIQQTPPTPVVEEAAKLSVAPISSIRPMAQATPQQQQPQQPQPPQYMGMNVYAAPAEEPVKYLSPSPYDMAREPSSVGPINHVKRHSPKHRILYQREYSSQNHASSSVPTGNNPSPTPTVNDHAFNMIIKTEGMVPIYPSPSALTADAKAKMRNPSGPSASQYSSGQKAVLSESAPSLNSELMQLLRTSSSTTTSYPATLRQNQDLLQQEQHMAFNAQRVALLHGPAHNARLSAPSAVLPVPPSIPPPPTCGPPNPMPPLFVPRLTSLSPSTSSSLRGVRAEPERRRTTHINAEQKRRGSIKNGFDLLRSLIPSLSQNSSVKISKAALLHKGGDYLQVLKTDRSHLQAEIEALQTKIRSLGADIATFQSCLSSPSGTSRLMSKEASYAFMEQMFHGHVKQCTLQNWKYWLFSLLMHPMLGSFDDAVSDTSLEDLARTTMSWLDQHFALTHLRASVLRSLTDYSKTSDVLEHPHNIPHEAITAVTCGRTKQEVKDDDMGHDDFHE